jgi:hypothetical protein
MIEFKLTVSQLLRIISWWLTKSIALLMSFWNNCKRNTDARKIRAASTTIIFHVDVQYIIVFDVLRMTSWRQFREHKNFLWRSWNVLTFLLLGRINSILNPPEI